MKGMLSWLFGGNASVVREARRTLLAVESLDERALPSVGLAFVGLAKAPASELTYLAGQFRSQTGEVEVSFLPFEFNPSNPFGNNDPVHPTGATKLAQETLTAGFKGKLRLTVDLEWFVHSSGDKNGKLPDGAMANVYGRQAQQAFWNAWAADNPTSAQQQIKAAFLSRVHQADAWVNQIRAWAVGQGVPNKLGVTFVPVLEDEFPTAKGYTNLVNAIKAQQSADNTGPTPLRRSRNGDNSANFRISGVSMEWHGAWKDVKGSIKSGDTWSNDGTHYDGTVNRDGSKYGIADFVRDGREAKKAGVSVLYWNADYNGTPKKDTNWASRTVNPFSGSSASANKARLTLVLDI